MVGINRLLKMTADAGEHCAGAGPAQQNFELTVSFTDSPFSPGGTKMRNGVFT